MLLARGLCFAFAISRAQGAAQFHGADAVIKELPESSKKGAESGEDIGAVTRDIAAFGKISATLPPKEAARRWLDLVDRIHKISAAAARTESLRVGALPRTGDLIAALPSPAAWPVVESYRFHENGATPGEALARNKVLELMWRDIFGWNSISWME